MLLYWFCVLLIGEKLVTTTVHSHSQCIAIRLFSNPTECALRIAICNRASERTKAQRLLFITFLLVFHLQFLVCLLLDLFSLCRLKFPKLMHATRYKASLIGCLNWSNFSTPGARLAMPTVWHREITFRTELHSPTKRESFAPQRLCSEIVFSHVFVVVDVDVVVVILLTKSGRQI